MIKHQILRTKIEGNVWERVTRISVEILEVKRLNFIQILSKYE